ncbi:MAG TPA: hypothetical protein VNB23_00625 [Ramlibacter sp.]|nr:hypothetical protein [Ramlibacter sp.]
MAEQNDAGAQRARQPYTLYAAGGRVYARNRDQKLIDLGSLERAEGGAFRYLLDGNQQSGEGFFTEDAALRDLSQHLRFLWLDGQFTAVADARGNPGLNLDGATEIEIELDELQPGEPAVDATV